MRNTFITELDGQWIVTVEFGDSRSQRYVCDSLALARRWALLLSHQSVNRGLPAA